MERAPWRSERLWRGEAEAKLDSRPGCVQAEARATRLRDRGSEPAPPEKRAGACRAGRSRRSRVAGLAGAALADFRRGPAPLFRWGGLATRSRSRVPALPAWTPTRPRESSLASAFAARRDAPSATGPVPMAKAISDGGPEIG